MAENKNVMNNYVFNKYYMFVMNLVENLNAY